MTREEWKQAWEDGATVVCKGLRDLYRPLGPEIEVRIDEWVFVTPLNTPPNSRLGYRPCPVQLKSLRRLTANELLTGEVER